MNKRHAIAAACLALALTAGLLGLATDAPAKKTFAQNEGKKCAYCHDGKPGKATKNHRALVYESNKFSFKGTKYEGDTWNGEGEMPAGHPDAGNAPRPSATPAPTATAEVTDALSLEAIGESLFALKTKTHWTALAFTSAGVLVVDPPNDADGWKLIADKLAERKATVVDHVILTWWDANNADRVLGLARLPENKKMSVYATKPVIDGLKVAAKKDEKLKGLPLPGKILQTAAPLKLGAKGGSVAIVKLLTKFKTEGGAMVFFTNEKVAFTSETAPLLDAGSPPDTRGTKPLTWREEWKTLKTDKTLWLATETVYCGRGIQGKIASLDSTIAMIDEVERLIRGGYAMGSRLTMMLEMVDRMPADQIAGARSGMDPEEAKRYMRQVITDIYNEAYPPDKDK